MANPSLKTMQRVGEFHQLFRWDIDISQIATLPLTQGGYTGNLDLDRITYQCESVDQPKKTIQSAEGNFRGVKIKQGGIPDFGGTIPFTFVESVDHAVSEMFNAWGNIVAQTKEDSEGNNAEGIDSWLSSVGPGYGADGGYKCDIMIYRLNGRKQRVYGLKLLGCYYEDTDPGGTLGSDSGDFSRPVLTLSFDAFVPIRIT